MSLFDINCPECHQHPLRCMCIKAAITDAMPRVIPRFSAIAVDPGKNGGIAFMGDHGGVGVMNMPQTDMDIANVFRADTNPRTVFLEKLVKHTGRPQPASRMAVYAGNHGVVRGALAAFKYRVVMVDAKDWQAALSLGSSKSHKDHAAWKRHLKQEAQRLFPQTDVTLLNADALLILESARRGLIG